MIIPHKQKNTPDNKIHRAKPLGVHIDDRLNSDYHIEQLCYILCQQRQSLGIQLKENFS